MCVHVWWLPLFAIFFETGFSLNLTLAILAKLPVSTPVLPPHWDYRHSACLAFGVDAGDPISGLHAYVASTLPIKV